MNIVERDIVFSHDGEIIYDPLKIHSEVIAPGVTTFHVTNMGDGTFEHLGLFIRPTSNMGPWDNPAENPPATDYQDLIMWGEQAKAGKGDGGLKIYYPVDDPDGIWLTRNNGSTWRNRIALGDLIRGASTEIKIKFIVPPDVDARRLFIDIVIG